MTCYAVTLTCVGLQVLTIKPRLVVDNQTGMAIEVKQRGTPDLDADPFYGGETRCSLRLEVNQRQGPQLSVQCPCKIHREQRHWRSLSSNFPIILPRWWPEDVFDIPSAYREMAEEDCCLSSLILVQASG